MSSSAPVCKCVTHEVVRSPVHVSTMASSPAGSLLGESEGEPPALKVLSPSALTVRLYHGP